MSDTAPVNAAPPPYAGLREDRLMPAVVYGLYLIGVGHLTIIIGLLIAYSCRGGAGPVAASHYNYQIRTFWLSIWWFIIGVGLVVVGTVLSITIILALIGVPMIIAGCAICGFVWLYVIIRAVIGLVHLLQDEPHPRPEGWLF
jgi:uncharacterized membrane protein